MHGRYSCTTSIKGLADYQVINFSYRAYPLSIYYLMFSFVVLSILFLGAHRVGGLWAVFIIRFIIGCWVWKRVSAIFLCLYIINIIIFSVFSKDISNFKTFSQMNSLIILIKIIIALMDFIWLLFFYFVFIFVCLFVLKTYRTKPALDPLCPPLSSRWWGCWCIIIILILTICLRESKTRAHTKSNILRCCCNSCM